MSAPCYDYKDVPSYFAKITIDNSIKVKGKAADKAKDEIKKKAKKELEKRGKKDLINKLGL